ncbi:hypothetical protein ABOONEI_1409 [Aciduliprofundum boonei T469]|nr:hypothetical protein ABOONEI_1409 [Aciduliprofundum boonei T469]
MDKKISIPTWSYSNSPSPNFAFIELTYISIPTWSYSNIPSTGEWFVIAKKISIPTWSYSNFILALLFGSMFLVDFNPNMVLF